MRFGVAMKRKAFQSGAVISMGPVDSHFSLPPSLPTYCNHFHLTLHRELVFSIGWEIHEGGRKGGRE